MSRASRLPRAHDLPSCATTSTLTKSRSIARSFAMIFTLTYGSERPDRRESPRADRSPGRRPRAARPATDLRGATAGNFVVPAASGADSAVPGSNASGHLFGAAIDGCANSRKLPRPPSAPRAGWLHRVIATDRHAKPGKVPGAVCNRGGIATNGTSLTRSSGLVAPRLAAASAQTTRLDRRRLRAAARRAEDTATAHNRPNCGSQGSRSRAGRFPQCRWTGRS